MNKELDFLASAKRTLEVERDAINDLLGYLNDDFTKACHLALACQGRVIVTGMGKSGHIGRKIAATLASTGTPSFFVHPGEASHGDLGMITRADVVVALSNSGETNEVLSILPLIKRMNAPLISITGNPESTLSRSADANLNVTIRQEACPLGLAPTSSTTASLVIGDALAIALLEARGFSAEDFAFSHPGGSLGRRLLLKVSDIMHSGDEIPRVSSSTMLKDALMEVTHKHLGMTTVVDEAGILQGVFTDGDLRRTLDHDVDMQNTPITDVMTTECTTVSSDILAAEALQIMQDKQINALIVLDEASCPVGALNMHDMLKAGVI
ncbi:KpsF/GutQ family sugar-phosphate isomerase [Amphritea sp. 1_MG-2023]|uniref:KpsF/GutQ family sugar-phosphate isomerase n=1 Tax=Amphritea sp. 1_MG-2023 TaxID=3062670 RepID=UPI0026E44D2B|nr:KpsF/GutQ family sugar-phosphate isomerase [Amphritea sp. 1_MG-2023]MDO6564060.1 KpsF/GutQ family sugar-phosphate isomerase [Amphritea sp. 1_MG-2023]